MKKDKYPFSGYIIPQSRNIKKSLQWKDIQDLLNYNLVLPKDQKALDIWKFSYLCNGMNISDVARLHNANVWGESCL